MDTLCKKLVVFKKELKNITNNQPEMKNIITDMKNTLEGIKNRLNEMEEWITEVKDSSRNHWQGREKIMKRNEGCLGDSDTSNHTLTL